MDSTVGSVAVSATVRYSEYEDVAVVQLVNPPVNALDFAARQGIAAGIALATASRAVRAIVLIGADRAFSAGADIRQFNTPAANARPMTRDLIDLMERSTKPVIAAIHGVALGGGLELAMGCHYRIVTPDASLALPETKLGLVPGGGGTQRLPRLVGVRFALDMILSGSRISGRQATELGLADALIEDETLDSALVFARKVSNAPRALPLASRKVCNNEGKLDFAMRLAQMDPEANNILAQRAALLCVEASTLLPFEEGLDFERSWFGTLVGGSESLALREQFFAKRQQLRVTPATGQNLSGFSGS